MRGFHMSINHELSFCSIGHDKGVVQYSNCRI
jgi:hypothetical protein